MQQEKVEPKLVKVVKFPRAKRGIEGVLKDAIHKAADYQWKKIIIIGLNADGETYTGWHGFGNRTGQLEFIGLLEEAKKT